MPEPMDDQTFAGPHPTCRELVAQLLAWGFTQRKDDHVHTVFRGPRGGTLRVLRSQLGRADPALVDKAARLAGVTPAGFWAGPEPAQVPATQKAHQPAKQDTATSLVLSVHARVDRPLGFDHVVELTGDRITRAQARAASAALCRDGHLDRIRPGVYQWSAGRRAARQVSQARRPEPSTSEPRRRPTAQPERVSAAELFSQLFPSGVQMTGELLADLQQWTQLTAKLATQDHSATDQHP